MIELDPNNPQHRALRRLILARSDIEAAQAAAVHVIDHVSSTEHPLFQPLTCATVICYARPFVRTKLYPGLPDKYESFANRHMRTMHDTIIDFRNIFVAHRDSQLNRVTLIPKGSKVSFSGGKSEMKLTSHGEWVRGGRLPLACFPLLRDLCGYQVARLREDIASEKERLFP